MKTIIFIIENMEAGGTQKFLKNLINYLTINKDISIKIKILCLSKENKNKNKICIEHTNNVSMFYLVNEENKINVSFFKKIN